ncbi:hypothetical protein RhiirA5_409988 [Rhizophagus irregularis]|uniref:Uncharacterized protein n=1 Tax=Rhizophagus irregularis TaxID=588596 RepID=A0A2I1EJM2_9GLOM|nr:hypothetical protein RhiirA5_409988 [Rhizophagus irregularis]PKC65853.1 hypothetical protein RhiirA1_536019 [Rhizophagus irregularis]PKY22305.1 hypothetical protein RhiirB3_436205 [Rhizophagus irregularis]GBC34790.1 hypothetical protein RIR_jg36120.t1 [Rhizophagus irregularis DAOM 181602=DAOM 197198]
MCKQVKDQSTTAKPDAQTSAKKPRNDKKSSEPEKVQFKLKAKNTPNKKKSEQVSNSNQPKKKDKKQSSKTA